MLRLRINSMHPQERHIGRSTSILRAGGLAVFPTDTAYGLGCDVYMKRSVDRIFFLKGLDENHHLSFLCSDLSQVAQYAMLENRDFRILRQHLPGPYTFILRSSRLVPKILQTPRRTVGIRIPENPVCMAMIRDLGHPLVTTSVSRKNQEDLQESLDPESIVAWLGRSIDLFLDAGPLHNDPSTIVDLTGEMPEIIRRGSGTVEHFVSL